MLAYATKEILVGGKEQAVSEKYKVNKGGGMALPPNEKDNKNEYKLPLKWSVKK